MKTHSRGFTLIELMIALVIASITAIVVLNVLMNYQTRKQTVAGSNDAAVSSALGMYAVEREVRMAGAGYASGLGLRCPQGVNLAYNGVTLLNGGQAMPLQIVDGGGAAPDQINLMRSNSNIGVAPITVMAPMATALSNIIVNTNIGLAANDMVLVTSDDTSQPCTVMQLTAAPVASGGNWSLTHGATSLYNPAVPAVSFTTAATYQLRDGVVNLGNFVTRRFEVVCNTGTVPTATNTCDLKWYDPLALGVAATMANTESVVSQVVDMQVQYGIAPAASQVVNAWVDATGAWAGVPALVDLARIKAVRVSIVSRGNLEPQNTFPTCPATVTLWDDGAPALPRQHTFSGVECRYRYQVLTVVIPLINVIWAGV
jgi:type IV pilus assembly protein PilW